jgi:hypothetical protein
MPQIPRTLRGSKPDYLSVENPETGEQAIIDLKKARADKIMRGFQNSVRFNNLYVKHISLDQAKESYHPKILNNFICSLKRAFPVVDYVWTVEVQEERYKKYGEIVLHWHILVAFGWDTDIDVDAIKRIAKYWKYGGCTVRSASLKRTGYLLKYITKKLDSPIESLYKLRRIGSSRIEGWLKQSFKRIMEAWNWFKQWYSDGDRGIDCLSDFYWSNGNAYIWDKWEIGGYEGKRKILVYKKKPSGWRIDKHIYGEAF